jgi:hypothetical protein
MNRRGFFGLLAKLVTVGTAMSVAPALLAPLKEIAEPEIKPWFLTEEQLKALTSKPVFMLAS